MKRKIALFTVFCIIVYARLCAGDVANFISLGFSNDGSTYAFGEYGVIDKTYQSYAEIYIIDVEKNEYRDNGVFRTSPSALTANKNSRSIFLGLQNRAAATLSKHKISEKNKGRPIYAQSEKSKHASSFNFRDFETNYEYSVVIHKNIKSLNAAFYITFDAISPDGSKKSYRVGDSEYFRKAVTDYNIKKILINDTNDALVFLIEKTVADSSGTNIRYMVETLKL